MVEKKFNFYNVFNVYYKNINESVFFFDLNLPFVIDEEKDLASFRLEKKNKYLKNYFGIFAILEANFIIFTDLKLLNTILYRKKKKIQTIFFFKKIYNINNNIIYNFFGI